MNVQRFIDEHVESHHRTLELRSSHFSLPTTTGAVLDVEGMRLGVYIASRVSVQGTIAESCLATTYAAADGRCLVSLILIAEDTGELRCRLEAHVHVLAAVEWLREELADYDAVQEIEWAAEQYIWMFFGALGGFLPPVYDMPRMTAAIAAFAAGNSRREHALATSDPTRAYTEAGARLDRATPA